MSFSLKLIDKEILLMRKVFSLSQYFLFCLAILFSFKSFAEFCNPYGIGIIPATNTTTCAGNITTDGSAAILYSSLFTSSTLNMIGNIMTTGSSSTVQ
jgi:hypothetical protein